MVAGDSVARLGFRLGRRSTSALPFCFPPLAARCLFLIWVLRLEGTGHLRVGDETLTVPRYGGVLVGRDQLRQVFNDTDAEVLWLIIGAPEELEFLPGARIKPDLSYQFSLIIGTMSQGVAFA